MSDQTTDPTPDEQHEQPADTSPIGDDAVAEAADENAEVQAKADEAAAKGYFGHVPDETPNEAYSLTTGPDAPPLAPDDRTRADQPAAPKEA